MFQNLNWYNLVVLLLLALFIFGDKLPQIISDVFRMLRNLRRMAQNATSDLSRELGTEIRVEDLHPKTFVRKHLLSESEQEALAKPLRGLSDDLREHGRHLQQDLAEAEARTRATVEEATGGARHRQPGRGEPPSGSIPAPEQAGDGGTTGRRARWLDDVT